jgi:hypothetical protein
VPRSLGPAVSPVPTGGAEPLGGGRVGLCVVRSEPIGGGRIYSVTVNLDVLNRPVQRRQRSRSPEEVMEIVAAFLRESVG